MDLFSVIFEMFSPFLLQNSLSYSPVTFSWQAFLGEDSILSHQSITILNEVFYSKRWIFSYVLDRGNYNGHTDNSQQFYKVNL